MTHSPPSQPFSGDHPQASQLKRGIRLLFLLILLIAGIVAALCLLPLCTHVNRLKLKALWSKGLLKVVGVTVDADLRHVLPGSLLVANHISWIDIFVINAVLPAAFVSKEEVRHWPVIGWLAAKNDTIFLRRGSRGHARLINQEIAKVLEQGRHVAVFPEGSTSDGCSLLHFHAALIQPALVAGRPVQPLALSYWHPDGQRSLAPRYDGDISLWECTRSLISQQTTLARLISSPALGLNGEDRRVVAAAAREAISAGAGLPRVSTAPETAPDLPV